MQRFNYRGNTTLLRISPTTTPYTIPIGTPIVGSVTPIHAPQLAPNATVNCIIERLLSMNALSLLGRKNPYQL